MRVGARLAVSTGMAVAATLGAFGISEQRVRRRELQAVMEAETQAVAAVTAAAIEAELTKERSQDQAAAAALALALTLRRAMDTAQLRVLSLDTWEQARLEPGQGERMRKVRILERPVGEFQDNPPRYALAFPVRGVDTDIRGVVEIERDARAVDRAGTAVALRLGITIAALIGALSLAVNTVIRRSVVKPIQRLLVGVDEVARGDLSRAVLVEREDEVGRLASHFNEMTAALREARDETRRGVEARMQLEDRLRHSEKLAAVGQLAAEIAHEVGTPLNVIGGRARSIEKKLSDRDAPELAKNARIIGEQVERIAKIIQQVLDYSRRRPTERTELDVAEAARVATDLLDVQLGSARVTARLAVREGLGVVRGDPTAIQQMCCNLILNAAQVTPQGGEVEVVTRRETRRREGLLNAPAQDWIVLEISDRGPGIAPEDRQRIFEPFFTTKPDGTGLGLAVTHGIVKDHDGWIEVAARDGGGTTIRVYLPAAVLDRVRARFVTPIETVDPDGNA